MHLVLNAVEVNEPDEFFNFKQKSIKKENSLVDFLEKNIVPSDENCNVSFPEIYGDFNGVRMRMYILWITITKLLLKSLKIGG